MTTFPFTGDTPEADQRRETIEGLVRDSRNDVLTFASDAMWAAHHEAIDALAVFLVARAKMGIILSEEVR